MERPAAIAERARIHAEHACVERAGCVDVPDCQDEVIEVIDPHTL
jgi:hypothetical protein